MACPKPKLTKVRNNPSNSSDTCRVCMRKSNTMKALFGPDCKIVERIHFCTGILLTENPILPSFICPECYSQLNIAHNFKTTCIESENAFRELDVKEEVKTENDEDEPDVKEEIELYEDETKINRETELKDNDPEPINEEKQDKEVPKLATKLAKGDKAVLKPKKTKGNVVSKEKNNEKPEKPKKIKTGGEFRKLYCGWCKIRFKTRDESHEHHQTLHKLSKFVCEVCGKQFLYHASHVSHMRIHTGQAYMCAHCPYDTVNKSDLKKHLSIHTGEKKFHCHACPATFRTSSNLSNHLLHKHGGKKRFFCNMCDKSFFHNHRLNRHLDSHNNTKRHECPICHSCFTRRCHWKKHLLKQHAVPTPPARPGRTTERLKLKSSAIEDKTLNKSK